MNLVREYFKNIKDSVVTIFDGMSITLAYIVQKPVTIQYPNRIKEPIQKSLPENYRGFLQVNHETCTSCEACSKACPIGCIALDGVKVPGRKGKAPVFFYINIAKCMFCGLCVEPCPSDSIYFTKEFEGASENIGNLVYSYISEEVSQKYIEEAIKLEKEKKEKGKDKGKAEEKE
jgi:NADH-quinone oxidoreductase subunit I/NAD(P)H-quinone oxidoreductase subunit I